MRHRNFGRKLSMDSSERTAMFRNMVTSLLLHEQIRTTVPRAKELRRFAEHVITLGKRAVKLDGLEGDALAVAKAKRVHSIRQARYWVHDDAALAKVFAEFAERYATRPGGYTRVLRAGRRPGDNAEMAIIQLVDRPAPVVETAAE
jgi:large subunit ribosomal protein L17